MEYISKYLLFIVALILTNSCTDEKTEDFKEVKATISLKLGDYTGTLSNPLIIKFTNLSGGFGQVFEKRVYKIEDIKLENLVPGQYIISVTGKLTQDEAMEIYGKQSSYVLNANLSNVEIYDYTEGKPIVVNIEESMESFLIFKEMYYCGSKTDSNSNYLYDKFFEIYNNSEEVIYLDSVCLANASHSGQVDYDFGEAAKDNLFSNEVWMIPGTGKDVPLEPGKSIVIAISATNHTTALSRLDLTSSDYETYVEKTSGTPLDYPATNMIAIYKTTTTKFWSLAYGGNGMILYKLDYPFDPNDIVLPSNALGSTKASVKIPKNAVLDAVDCIADESKYLDKKFPASIDAGFATVGAGWIAKSVARKIKETTPEGRIIFQDTNNSSEDFEVMDTPQIRRYLNN